MGRGRTRAGPKIQYSNRIGGRFAHRKKKLLKEGYEAPFENFVFRSTIFFPEKIMEFMQKTSKKRNISINRLVVYAVFKEILNGGDFKNYDFEIPKVVEHPELYRDGVKKLYAFIKNYRKEGIDRELAYFSMWDAKISTPHEWCHSYRILLDTGAITEFRTTTKNRNYARKVKATDETGGTPLGTITNKT
jgi:hypothetical protein